MSMTAPPRIELAFCATALRPVVANYLAPVLKAYVAAFYSGGVQVGGRVTVTATDGNFWTSLDVPPPGTYTVRLFSEDGLTLVSETVPFTVPGTGAATPAPTPAPAAAPSGGPIAPDGTLSGLPSTIAAGQPLSAATYGQSTLYFVLYRVAAAVEEGLRWQGGRMPANLGLLIPQTAGAYTVRGYDAATAGNKVYESLQISVTAAPGALPAIPTQMADSGATSSGVTMNWTATATSYRVLARPGVGTVYGSLADATVATNSYTFSGLAPNASPRAIVIPQNGSGYGTPSGQFVSFAGF